MVDYKKITSNQFECDYCCKNSNGKLQELINGENKEFSLNELLDLLKKGNLETESYLKKYIENGTLSPLEFEESLKEGQIKAYEIKLNLIKDGLLSYKIEALKIAEEFNFPISKIEEAIIIGSERLESNGLSLVKEKKLPYEIFLSCLNSKYCKYLNRCKIKKN